jgi:hypothetical protein
MAGAGFIGTSTTGAASAVGVAMASCGGTAASGRAVARAVGAASGRHSSCRDEKASVSTNAPTPSPHKSIRLSTSAPAKDHNASGQS